MRVITGWAVGIALCAAPVAGSAQTAKRRPVAKKAVEAAKPEPAVGTLSMEAGIVYTNGPQPVAREEFRLLRKSLRELTLELRASPEYKATEDADAAERAAKGDTRSLKPDEVTDDFAALMQVLHRNEATVRGVFQGTTTGTRLDLMDQAVQKATVASMKTGFDGKGTFEPVPAGSYFVFGVTTLRGGKTGRTAVWCVPVEVKATGSSLILDQSNMMGPWPKE